MLYRLITVVAYKSSEWCVKASLFREYLSVSLSQVLPIFNRDCRSKSHRLLVAAEAKLDLAVLAELASAQEVVCCLVQSVLLLGISRIGH